MKRRRADGRPTCRGRTTLSRIAQAAWCMREHRLGWLPDTRADAELAVRFVERLEGVVAVIDRLTYRYDERLAATNIAPLA